MTARYAPFRIALASMVVLAALVAGVQRGEAHKAVTSKYTYNDDVFPILRERCSQCHVTGGVAPMSLMTYEEAFPWAESIRAELVAAHMPPWNAEDGFGDLKRAHALPPKELDILLTWATGGNPRGALDQKLPEVTLRNDWTLGAPDLAVKMPAEFTLAADKMDDTQEFTLPTGTTEARWVRAVDLLPGTPAIVRSATIFVKDARSDVMQPGTPKPPGEGGPGAPVPERVLAHWLPGHEREPIDSGTAFRLPAGAQLGVRVHYKKTWQLEGKPMADRSTVGLYFSPGTGTHELLMLPIDATSTPAPGAAAQTVTFNRTLNDDMQVLALSPDAVPPNITLQVEAVRPDGSRAPMIRLNTRADWARRYWFEKPLTLPRGTKIEVTANFEDPDILSAAFAAAPAAVSAPRPATLRLTLNVLPANAKPAAP
jgi:hypothetical protein